MKKLSKYSILIAALFSLSACYSSSPEPLVDPCALADSYSAYEKQEFASAFTSCKAWAEGGNPVSQRTLGYMYLFGNNNVAQNFQESMRWFSLAAEKGDQSSMYRLQMIYAANPSLMPPQMQVALSGQKNWNCGPEGCLPFAPMPKGN